MTQTTETMKKRIDVKDLTIGMYVSELDRPWLETPFMFQGFEISSQQDIADLHQYCKFVYVDVEQAVDVVEEPKPKAPAVITQSKTESEPEAKQTDTPKPPTELKLEAEPAVVPQDPRVELEMLKKQAKPVAQVYQDITKVEEEIQKVQKAHEFASALIPTIMEDVRLGRSVKVGAAKRVITELAGSIIRNPDALMCYAQLKHRDTYTAEHSLRVSILAMALGRHLGFERDALEVLGIGALLHDIGKMKIPLDILNKPCELTSAEAELMETHVPEGVKLLDPTNIARESIEVTMSHHERYDGSGYRIGRKGDAIGQFGMIGGIVDFYDALTSDRCYRDGLPPHRVLRDMYGTRGRLFHPELIEQFIQCMGIYPVGSVVELDSGDVGVVVNMNRRRRLKPRVTLVLRPDATPYETPKTLDLAKEMKPTGAPYEVATVVDPGKYHIDAARYLTLPNSLFSANAASILKESA